MSCVLFKDFCTIYFWMNDKNKQKIFNYKVYKKCYWENEIKNQELKFGNYNANRCSIYIPFDDNYKKDFEFKDISDINIQNEWTIFIGSIIVLGKCDFELSATSRFGSLFGGTTGTTTSSIPYDQQFENKLKELKLLNYRIRTVTAVIENISTCSDLSHLQLYAE